jgi:uncharacterized membrane protein HdeD (DUF308 family)
MSEASVVGAVPEGDVKAVLAGVGRHWGWLLAFGVLSVALGVVLLVWPGRTILVLSVFLGAYLLVSGIFQVVAAFAMSDQTTGFRWLTGISGFLSILLGMFAFRSLAHSVEILVLLIGFGWMIHGFAELVEGITDHTTPGRGWQIFWGILGIIAAIVVLVWPAPSLLALAIVAGIWLIVLGLFEIFGAFRLRSVSRAT